MPYEYAAIGKTLEDWQGTDVIATASLIGGIFGKGGGNEVGSAVALEEAKDRFGGAAGEQAWRDFRRQDDPEAPTTVKSGNGSFDYPSQRGIRGCRAARRGLAGGPARTTARHRWLPGPSRCSTASGRLSGMSNALLVSGAESESGRPVAVMGPQVAYFMPQILVEMDLHGPDIDAQGAAFAGVSPYVLLGRGQDYAWSATSAGQDIIDTFAEKLCEPDGSAAGRPIHPLPLQGRVPADGDPHAGRTTSRPTRATPRRPRPTRWRRSARCTASSPSAARSTEQPVAFARQRSTYFHEADSARAFAAPQPALAGAERRGLPARRSPRSTSRSTGSTPTIATSPTSTRATTRCGPRAPTRTCPNWGTGEYDWQGWETTFKTSDVTPFAEHPQVVNQDYITLLEQQAGARLRLGRRPVRATARSTARTRSTTRSTSGSPARAR